VSLDDRDNGVVIREVEADSPAAAADLQVDDVIVSINGTNVENARAAVEAIRGLKTGDQVSLEIQRGDDTMTVEATLGSMMSDGVSFCPKARNLSTSWFTTVPIRVGKSSACRKITLWHRLVCSAVT